ncbi:hypothetical protein LCGC14_1452370 [marine sediment metagenome]|uniref:Uncharacterized protein n=1 Tax=marine sediment metagenome TaxID=412755 RepID=A0A0F9LY71_9ZZZZ
MKKVKGNYSGKSSLEWSTLGLHKRVLSLIKENGGIALDVGCGSGSLANCLIEKGYNVIGSDIENFLKFSKVKFNKSDLDEKWNFEDDSMDLITAIEIIEHLENPRHFIREIKRVLKIGGKAIISTPNIFNWKARIYYPLKGIIWGFRKMDYEISGHITPITKYDLERICGEEKLKIELITYDNSDKELKGNNLIVIIKKLKSEFDTNASQSKSEEVKK